MPYQPIRNPMFWNWEPWPHVYRRGSLITNVTDFPGAKVPPWRTIAPDGPATGGLGEAKAVPWQCWDTPGFKDCWAECFTKAQKTGVSAAAQEALIEQCHSSVCVTDCEKKLGPATPGSTTPPPPATGGGSGGLLGSLGSMSPVTLAIGAAALAIVVTMAFPPKKGKK
jgi:hypothetical protein